MKVKLWSHDYTIGVKDYITRLLPKSGENEGWWVEIKLKKFYYYIFGYRPNKNLRKIKEKIGSYRSYCTPRTEPDRIYSVPRAIGFRTGTTIWVKPAGDVVRIGCTSFIVFLIQTVHFYVNLRTSYQPVGCLGIPICVYRKRFDLLWYVNPNDNFFFYCEYLSVWQVEISISDSSDFSNMSREEI